VVLTCVATVVGRNHQKFRTRVLDDVMPVDGVSVAQELVLIHIHASIQDFWYTILEYMLIIIRI